jgi:hypothetical protein
MVAATAMTVPAQAYEEGAVSGGGSITGKVVFNGTPATRKVIPTKDVDVCGRPYEEALIEVGPDKSVQNTVVYLVDIAKGKAWPAQAALFSEATRVWVNGKFLMLWRLL